MNCLKRVLPANEWKVETQPVGVDTVSMKQNDEKFDEIGEERVKPRASGSSAETLQHANGPQNVPETAQKSQKFCLLRKQHTIPRSTFT